MVQNDFAQMVKRELERRGVEVIIAPVLKNNGLKLTGITIKIGQASPTLYLDSVPEEHRNPFMVPRIADEILEKAQEFKGVDAVLDLMGNKEKLLKRIRPRLVNYDWNKEMLTTLSHRRFLDLAVTYAIDIGENAACRVSNELGFTEDDLYTAAMENARNHGYNIRSLSEIVQDAVMLDLPIEPLPMLVVTNRSGFYGAFAMLDNEVLKEIGEKFYILPSSIHELRVIPIQNTESVSNLRELVKAVNSSNVPLEEWLSESVYVFDGEVEAADDIAYLTADIEDAYHKGLISLNELLDYLKKDKDDDCIRRVIENVGIYKEKFKEIGYIEETDDYVIRRLRIYIKGLMLEAVSKAFDAAYPMIMDVLFESEAGCIASLLKEIEKERIYYCKSILTNKLKAYSIISKLLETFIPAIVNWNEDIDSGNDSANNLLFMSISKNYR